MKCSKIEILISAYLDGETTQSEWREVQAHISHCSKCAELFESFQKSTTLFKEKAAAFQPSSDLWPKLQKQINTLDELSWRDRLRVRFLEWVDGYLLHPPAPVRLVQVAVATVVVMLIVNQTFLKQTETQQAPPIAQTNPPVIPAAPAIHNLSERFGDNVVSSKELSQKVLNYFDRAGVMLLDIKNSDADYESDDLSALRESSQMLLDDSIFLKEDLKRAENRMLRQTIEQLEMILLDLSNLAESPDSTDFELLRTAIIQNNMLIKIEMLDLKKLKENIKQLPPDWQRKENTPMI